MEEIKVDDVRDHLYTTLRTAERFASNLKTFLDSSLQEPVAGWLDVAANELSRNSSFFQTQHELSEAYESKLKAYIAFLKDKAFEELSAEGIDGQEKTEEGKTVHPELHRFKLEKKAKILGYGASPAFGLAGPLSALKASDAKLKATVSPAAREIQYSRVENKDARYLAEVMHFKKEKEEAGLAQWQEEAVKTKGKDFARTREDEEKEAKSKPPTPIPINKELAARLAARQASVSAQEEAEAATAAEAALKAKHAELNARALGEELAGKFAKRQASLAEAEGSAGAERSSGGDGGSSGSQGAAPDTPQPGPSTPITPASQRAAGFAFPALTPAASGTPAATLRPTPVPTSVTTPAAAGAVARTPSAAPSPRDIASELQERFRRMREQAEGGGGGDDA